MRLLLTVMAWSMLPGCLMTCKTAQRKPAVAENTMTAQQPATDKKRNETGEYELHTQAANAAGRMEVSVIRVSDQKVVWQKNIRAGYAKWVGTTWLEVLDAPGTLKQHETMDDYLLRVDIAVIRLN
ncbi:MAG: hypothetical protein MUC38_05670 [Cyclobacteriaceae bacterium]|jgi:hypothetical protein|nr:hypothetical protein [Cyclobacteriaceae bacterium]